MNPILRKLVQRIINSDEINSGEFVEQKLKDSLSLSTIKRDIQYL